MTEESFWSSKKAKTRKSFEFWDVYNTDSDSSDQDLWNDFEEEMKTFINNEISGIKQLIKGVENKIPN